MVAAQHVKGQRSRTSQACNAGRALVILMARVATAGTTTATPTTTAAVRSPHATMHASLEKDRGSLDHAAPAARDGLRVRHHAALCLVQCADCRDGGPTEYAIGRARTDVAARGPRRFAVSRSEAPRGRRGQGQALCPRQDSNLRIHLRRVALYPLSYEGGGWRIPGRNSGPSSSPRSSEAPAGRRRDRKSVV